MTKACRVFAIYLFAAAAALGQPIPTATIEPEELGRSGDAKANLVIQREQWFYGQRAYPNDRIPAGARERAWKQRLAMERNVRISSAGDSGEAAASLTPWMQRGPEPANFNGLSSGRATSIAIDPTDNNIIYLGSAGGGVWKTTDGGQTWSPLTDFEPSLAIGSLTLDPRNHNIVYAGTGEEDFSGDSYYGAGILKSTDGGATWTQMRPNIRDSIGSIAISPSDSNLILAGFQAEGVLRSADGGATWTAPLAGTASGVVFNPQNPSVVYAALGNPWGDAYNGIYKSTDSGVTWTLMPGTGANTIPAAGAGRIALAMDPHAPNTLYAGLAKPVGSPLTASNLGIYKTTDGGANWALLSVPDGCCTWYSNALTVSPANPNLIVTGDHDPMRSLDGGLTWQSVAGLHPDQHAFAFSSDGSKVYAANDGGVWVSSNLLGSSPSWTSLNSTIATINFYPGLAIDPGNSVRTYGGAQDAGTLRYSGQLLWNYAGSGCGDGSYNAIDYSSPSTAYAAGSSCIADIRLAKTVDDGVTWTSALNGIDSSDRGAWVLPLAMDPSNHSTLYYGTYRLYRTTDGAATWTPISGDLTNGQSNINAIAVAPSDANTVWVGTGDSNVQVTNNASAGSGATWTLRNGGLPSRVVTAFAISPVNAAVVYVTLSGFDLTGKHVFLTTNSGMSWTDISGNLPNAPVNDIAYDAGTTPPTLYVATDVGVFTTSNNGASWSVAGTGMPNVVVTSVRLIGPARILRAATHGRSVWDLALPFANPPTNVFATATSSTNIQVSWSGSCATTCNVYRSADHLNYSLAGSSMTSPFNDTVSSSPTSYLYRVRAYNGATESADSNFDLATNVIFTDDYAVCPIFGCPLIVVKAVHLTEMRTAVNAVRSLAGLALTSFTDPSPAGVLVKAVHVTELRTSLDTARAALGLSALTYTNTLTVGTTLIRAVDFKEIRNGTK